MLKTVGCSDGSCNWLSHPLGSEMLALDSTTRMTPDLKPGEFEAILSDWLFRQDATGTKGSNNWGMAGSSHANETIFRRWLAELV